jgi:hypothetical protein
VAVKPLKRCSFMIDGTRHYARIQRTGDKIPQPARIVVLKEYWSDVGGWKGWDTVTIYDKTFEDWDRARAVYGDILRWADEGSIREF